MGVVREGHPHLVRFATVFTESRALCPQRGLFQCFAL